MAFLDRPGWYGRPILTRPNIVRLSVTLAIVVIVTGVAVLAVGMFSDADSKPVKDYVALWVALTLLLIFVPAWAFGVFSWFRIVVNFIAMRRSFTHDARKWNLDRVLNPAHGWRSRDLTEKGMLHRRLAFEGLIGFLAVQALVWGLAYLGQLFGLDLIAS